MEYRTKNFIDIKIIINEKPIGGFDKLLILNQEGKL